MTIATPSFATLLIEAVQKTRSVTCVGLDPRKANLPEPMRQAIAQDRPEEWAAAYTQFCCGIIDVVAGKVPCVKPQAAFFEQLGPAGMISLGEVVRYARSKQLLVILDGKRNDIGSTATAYADAYLGADSPWQSDSLTVSPYLGQDSIEPFVDVCDQRSAGIFVLVKTSNPGGGLLQNRETDGQSVFQRVAELLTDLNKPRLDSHGYGPLGAVVGATYPEELAQMRQAMPHSVILIPGFGAQGGAVDDVKVGFHAGGLGAVVNSSRHIIFAYQRPEYAEKFAGNAWQRAVEAATDDMNQQLNFCE